MCQTNRTVTRDRRERTCVRARSCKSHSRIARQKPNTARSALGVSVRSQDDSWSSKCQYNVNIGASDPEPLTHGAHKINSNTMQSSHVMQGFQERAHITALRFETNDMRNLSVVMPRPPLRLGSLGLACGRKYKRRETERECRWGQVGRRVVKGASCERGTVMNTALPNSLQQRVNTGRFSGACGGAESSAEGLPMLHTPNKRT